MIVQWLTVALVLFGSGTLVLSNTRPENVVHYCNCTSMEVPKAELFKMYPIRNNPGNVCPLCSTDGFAEEPLEKTDSSNITNGNLREEFLKDLIYNSWCSLVYKVMNGQYGGLKCTVQLNKKECKLQCLENDEIDGQSSKEFQCFQKKSVWEPAIDPCVEIANRMVAKSSDMKADVGNITFVGQKEKSLIVYNSWCSFDYKVFYRLFGKFQCNFWIIKKKFPLQCTENYHIDEKHSKQFQCFQEKSVLKKTLETGLNVPNGIVVKSSDRKADAGNNTMLGRKKRSSNGLDYNSWCSLDSSQFYKLHGEFKCSVWIFKKECKLYCHDNYYINGKSSEDFQCFRFQSWKPAIKPCVAHGWGIKTNQKLQKGKDLTPKPKGEKIMKHF